MKLLSGLVLWLVAMLGTAGLGLAATRGAEEISTSRPTWTLGSGKGGSAAILTQPLKRPVRQSRARPKGQSMTRTIEYLAAFLSDVEMKHCQSYLERGRTYSTMPVDALSDRWAAAYVAATGDAGQTSLVEYADLSAEFRLRDLPLPAHLVREAAAAVRRRIGTVEPEDLEMLEEGLRRFRAELRQPKN